MSTVVFADIVGFSRRNEEQQRALIHGLGAEVTHQLYTRLVAIEPTPNIIALPTGDGVALAVVEDSDARWSKEELFALVIKLMEWATSQGTKMRIGVHAGPVSVIRDLNRRPNVCGVTVNDCQRVMDAAHDHQVLLSKAAFDRFVGSHAQQADGLAQLGELRFRRTNDINTKHGDSIPVYIMSHIQYDWDDSEPFPGEIRGRRRRTEFIVNRLREVLRGGNSIVREQSAFSTFGISASGGWSGEGDVEYMELVQEQVRVLSELAARDDVRVQLILYPSRSYQWELMRNRIQVLVERLSLLLERPNVDFVLGEYDGPNRVIIDSALCIDGYKIHDRSGYDLTIVRSKQKQLEEANADFNKYFQRARNAGSTKESVMKKLVALLGSGGISD